MCCAAWPRRPNPGTKLRSRFLLASAGRPESGLPAHIVLDPRALSLAEGVRAALSVAGIVALNEWLNWPPVMMAALAAWLTCIGDAGGPVRSRVRASLVFACLGAAITAAFGLLRGAPLPLVLPLASAGIFVSMFVRIYGQTGLQTGNLLAVVLVLAMREPLANVAEAAVLAGMFLAGSLWAVLLTLVIWRLYPYLPARRAVASCFRALGALVADLRDMLAYPSTPPAMWERHARAHRRYVRETIEMARNTVLAAVRARGPVQGRAAEAWIRLETADGIFGALIGLSEMLEESEPAVRAAAHEALRWLAPVLNLLADYIVTEAPARLGRLERAVASMERAAPEGSSLRAAAALIADKVRIAITLAGGDGGAGLPREALPPWRERVLGPIRANLNRRSAVLLHALRVAAVSAVAFAYTIRWPTQYDYWMTITLLLTMQPFFALTFTRALERIGGTVLGGAAASVIAIVVKTPLALALALFPLTLMAMAVRRVGFGLFIAFVTPVVILLSELSRPAEAELSLAFMRALYTVIGGGLAVLGSVWLWPSWEPGRLVGELRGAIAAHGRYARTELDAVLGESGTVAVEQARRAAGLASNNVEASLQRLLLEPHSEVDLTPALTVDAALRRMAGRLSALQLDPGEGHDPTLWHAWRDWIEEATARLGRGETGIPPRPALPKGDRQADALLRLGRQVELVASALSRVRVA